MPPTSLYNDYSYACISSKILGFISNFLPKSSLNNCTNYGFLILFNTLNFANLFLSEFELLIIPVVASSVIIKLTIAISIFSISQAADQLSG
mmetsp:Transcript_3166/g.291  ORF Transcript_3166/g.291 Transcript_3166/m.291 type:complete len:92 (-) Transcript_3166:297-572(-)